MTKYEVTRTQEFVVTVYADSEEDAEMDAITSGDFKFVDEEYSVKEVC
jgi:hypothetical protein